MQFNRNSWHYKLLTEGEFKTDSLAYKIKWSPISLCPYARAVLKQLIVSILVYGIIVSVAVSLLYAPAIVITWLVYGIPWINPPAEFLYLVGSAIYTFIAIIAAIIGTTISIKWIRTKLPKRKQATSVHKEPNLLVEYIKAVHKKVCPIITFKD